VPAHARAYFFGDSWTEGQVARRGRGFPFVTSELLGWTPTVDGVGSTGYLSHWRPSTLPYPVRAAAIPAGTKADVVILEGGLNDRTMPLSGLRAAVRETITTLRAKFPGAPIVVLGPAANTLPVPATVRQVDRLVAQASADEGAPYISPIQREWLTGLNFRDVIDAPSHHPTTAGHAYLGGRLAVALQDLMTHPQDAGATSTPEPQPSAPAG
jgi:lysophospholipase L1-like esterase